MIRNQSGLDGVKNKVWLAAFVWHTRIVKSRQASFGLRIGLRIARRAGVGSALFRLGRFLPRPPVAGSAVHPSAQDVPKILWMYWHDGEDAAPELARYCIDSWRKHNPDWDVRVLDSSSAPDYVTIDYVPAGTRLQLVADALRLELLNRYGGVWADASCLCTGPLADWLTNRLGQGFFAFERPGSDRQLGNWFLASRPGSPLVASWVEVSRLYWRNGFYSNHIQWGRRDHFIYHYLFEWMINSSRQLRSEWQSVPTLPAGRHLLLQKCLRISLGLPSAALPGVTWPGVERGFEQLDQAAIQRLITDIVSSPDVRVHKLDWRLENALQILSTSAGADQSVDHRDVPLSADGTGCYPISQSPTQPSPRSVGHVQNSQV